MLTTPAGTSAWRSTSQKSSAVSGVVSAGLSTTVFPAARAGVVWANTFNRFDPTSPFGGYKESGYGREGGIHGLSAYLDLSANGTNGR